MPNPEPRTLREHFVVPSIRSRDVACAEWSYIRRFEDALQLAAQFAGLLPSFNSDPPKGTSVHNEEAYGQH